VKPASYYKWRSTREERSRQDQDIKEHMMANHFMYPEFGYPRITTYLKDIGYVINHKKLTG
jgi:putative transposase